MEYALHGQCRCGNITLQLALSAAPSVFTPRACDCDFCTRHHAAYISDRHGKLQITIADESKLERYRQGSRIADFLLCRECGELAGVIYEESGRRYGSVNRRLLSPGLPFAAEAVVSPKQLDDAERIQRWQQLWFADVTLHSPATTTGNKP